MRVSRVLYASLVSFVMFTGCSRDEQAPIPLPQPTQYLIGMGNHSWKIQEVYINGVAQTLTAMQKTMVKTYRVDAGNTTSGKVTTNEGVTGNWDLLSAQTLQETYSNYPQMPVPITYTIHELSSTRLDVSYTINNELRREVFIIN